jgi:hypothetical protein
MVTAYNASTISTCGLWGESDIVGAWQEGCCRASRSRETQDGAIMPFGYRMALAGSTLRAVKAGRNDAGWVALAGMEGGRLGGSEGRAGWFWPEGRGASASGFPLSWRAGESR